METPTRTDARMTAATGEARTTLGALDTLEAEVGLLFLAIILSLILTVGETCIVIKL